MAKLRDQSRVYGDLFVDDALIVNDIFVSGTYNGNISYTNLSNIPIGIASSSAQVNTGSFSGSFIGTATTASFLQGFPQFSASIQQQLAELSSTSNLSKLTLMGF
jgi:hypothetical protein